jgi:hypothetical protein
MSRVYTVKSNARRDARKLGLDPEVVKAVVGGFVIDYPDAKIEKLIKPKKPKVEKTAEAEPKPKAAKPPKAPKAAKVARAKREGDPKRDRLVAMLADWTPLSELMSAMGWQAHTVRGALSTAAKARNIKIERRRVEGVTSYRAAGIEG